MLATAKIHILKQLTTNISLYFFTFWLCLLLQRYTFWSNSQLACFEAICWLYCACYCKDTHFEAIHNASWYPDFVKAIVLATAKIHILKQFTTTTCHYILIGTLCLLLQRYTFWSNSQRSFLAFAWILYCACYCKDTHFEAIHNLLNQNQKVVSIVLATAKIHILKQFTTDSCGLHVHMIVLATAKIHILKQFTTKFLGVRLNSLLCLLLQRYTFWSNSQRCFVCWFSVCYCACYCKDTHFEAIHNKVEVPSTDGVIVLATAKIHILKQFTTHSKQ